MTRREAIENLDYEWLISNENDINIKNQLIQMYFDHIQEEKEDLELQERSFSAYMRKINLELEREIKNHARK